MMLSVKHQMISSTPKKSLRRSKSLTILGMIGRKILKLEMDKTSGQLDQSLVKGIVWGSPPILEPEMLEHIMCLVITLGIKALKITQIAGIEA